MFIMRDHESDELCTADYFPIKCPHCRRSVCAHEELVCATLSVGSSKHQLIYHARHLDGDQRDTLENAGFDLVEEFGERMVG